MNGGAVNQTANVCAVCSAGAVEVHSVDSIYDADGVSLRFREEFSRCSNCHDEFYSREQSLARSRAITTAVRKHQGRMSGDEIRAARVALGMSLPQFERAFGVAEKTAGRWERGTVSPIAAAEVGLWLAANYPEIFLEFAQKGATSRNVHATARTETKPPLRAQAPAFTVISGSKSGSVGRFTLPTSDSSNWTVVA